MLEGCRVHAIPRDGVEELWRLECIEAVEVLLVELKGAGFGDKWVLYGCDRIKWKRFEDCPDGGRNC